jgi:hypothetical protein
MQQARQELFMKGRMNCAGFIFAKPSASTSLAIGLLKSGAGCMAKTDERGMVGYRVCVREKSSVDNDVGIVIVLRAWFGIHL